MMKDESLEKSQRLAVLIDADNANSDLIEPLLQEIAKYGTAHVKRIYGDWTQPRLQKWKEQLNRYAIQPIQQFSYTTGKNATDSALIIDAMDLLYARNFDGFCIISSDSDFTRLASRIRESGLKVYGFGEQKTPEPFVSACDKFIYTEILDAADGETTVSGKSGAKAKDRSHNGTTVNHDKHRLKNNKKLVSLLKLAYESVSGEDGWTNLATFGSQLNKLSSAFDPRNYGHKKLGELVKSVDLFDIEETPHKKNPTIKEIHIRLKD